MDTNSVKRQYIMLKPMATGVNGFARLEMQTDRILLQLTCKDLKNHAHGLRIFLYAGEGAVQELARTTVNGQGQATVTTEIPQRQWSLSPSRLQAILILSDDAEPKPLMIGVCTQQSAGSLMDAKNALLALCSKLSVPVLEKVEPSPPARPTLPVASTAPIRPSGAVSPEADVPVSTSRRSRLLSATAKDPTPQEVFLSAIDPTLYIPARTEKSGASLPLSYGTEEAALPQEADPPVSAIPRRPDALPVDRLRPLEWPSKWRELAPHFASRMPVAPFHASGWRFVRIPMSKGGSFVVGMHWQDQRVNRISYAVPGVRTQAPPKELSRYRWQQGRDGQGYWVLWQEAK